jgi:hypothetical protein
MSNLEFDRYGLDVPNQYASVYKDNRIVGDISYLEGSFFFNPLSDVDVTADDLRAIADEIDRLNGERV